MTSTAYRYWDSVWRDPELRQGWEVPSPWVMEVLAPAWRDAGVREVLDLGCGPGRHAVALSRLGFSVRAVDKSHSACARARQVCVAAGAVAEVITADTHSVPFADASFDAILAFNVIYHGDGDAVLTSIAEVTRLLRPSGRYAATMLSKRNIEYGKGIEIAPGTFVQPEAKDDKIHPHLYCDAAGLIRLHPGLELLSCQDVSQAATGSYHWHCEFERGGET